MPKKPIFGQYNLLAEIDKDTPVDSRIIRKGDPRYDSAMSAWMNCKRFGLDIETYALGGKSGLNPWEASIRLIQVAVQDTELGDFVLLWDLESDGDLSLELMMLEVMLAQPEVYVVGHNLKFDLLFLRVKYGMRAVDVRDTMLLSQILWAGIKITKQGMLKHSLQAVAERCGIQVSKDEQLSDWAVELTNKQLNYAAQDALVVLEILPILFSSLRSQGLLQSALAESLALPAFVEMEFYGMPVDEKRLDELVEDYQNAREKVIKPFKKKFPLTNPASPEKVLHVLRGTYGPLDTTSAQELFLMSQEVPESQEVVRSLYLWRSLGTQVEYLKGIKDHVRDGRVRSDFRQIGPRGSGRSTSSKPNLQNPSNLKPSWHKLGLSGVREIFKAPRGKRLIISDLSSAHARIATEASKDPNLLLIYNSGMDLHSVTTAGVAKVKGQQLSPEEINDIRKDKGHELHEKINYIRRQAKTVFFGSLNCQAGYTLRDTFLKEEDYVTERECDDMVIAWEDTYQTLRQYQWDIYHKVKKSNLNLFGNIFGEIRGLTGRRLYVDKLEGKFKMTEPVSFVWLSTEADIIKRAMGRIYLLGLKNPRWDLRIVNFCHDEIDLEVKTELAEEAAAQVKQIMDEEMTRVIKSIPAFDDSVKPKDLIAKRWSEK
jgi:DNA polymerase I-like protein with 3'-5' exonuclease and polymerase domains